MTVASGVAQQDDGAAQAVSTPSIDLAEASLGLGGGVAYERRDEVSLTRVFQRPVAFGVDALMLAPKRIDDRLSGECAKENFPCVPTPFRQDPDLR